jgi:hypothetical protein
MVRLTKWNTVQRLCKCHSLNVFCAEVAALAVAVWTGTDVDVAICGQSWRSAFGFLWPALVVMWLDRAFVGAGVIVRRAICTWG